MDGSFTIKPRSGVSPRANVSRDPVAVRETVDTELDPAKVVAATADGSPKQHNNGPHDEASAREVIIDPKGQEVLFGAVDIRTEHADQFPNQALMRQRAYRQRLTPSADENPSNDDPHADIEA
jgi:hypothetical protein